MDIATLIGIVVGLGAIGGSIFIAAAEAGVTSIIQPGGSIRDDEVIDAANKLGLSMVFSGIRHFRH